MFKVIRHRDFFIKYRYGRPVRYLVVLRPQFLRKDLAKLCLDERFRYNPAHIFTSIEWVRKTVNGRVVKPGELRKKWRELVYGRDAVLDIDVEGKNASIKERIEEAHDIAGRVIDYLREEKLPFCIVFSGSKGFHIYIPFPCIEEAIRRLSLEIPLKWPEISRLAIRIQEEVVRGAGVEGLVCRSTFDIVKDVIRVPYSVHPSTGLVALPLSLRQFENFDLEALRPEEVLALRGLGRRGMVQQRGDLAGLLESFLRQ